MALIDCHVHITDEVFRNDLNGIINECSNNNIFAIAVGMSYSDFQDVVEISENHGNIAMGLGLHPIQKGIEDKRPLSIEDTYELESWISKYHSKLVCLGECGLDFSKWLCPTSVERDQQRHALVEQVKLSKKYDLPLNLHSRSAGKPLLELLRQNGVKGSLLHAFDGGKKAIRQGVEDGHYFSIAPSIVRDPSQRQVASSVPLDRIVLESDAPALGPVKGETNTPLNILKTVEVLAELHGLTKQDIAGITTRNALRLFPKLRDLVKL